MEYISYLIDLFINLDKHLIEITTQYGTLTHLLLFGIIFAETGLVFTPFLPGDSLLFAAGSIAALGSLKVELLLILLIIAPILGDSTNYWVGRLIGIKLFEKFPRVLKKEYLDKTHAFYEKHGGKTVILARFVPIVRTFAPFVAGLGSMQYGKFVANSVFGSIIWVSLFVLAGYYFGNLPLVKNNFTIVILVIIFLSLLPGIIEYIRHKRESKAQNP